MHQKSRLAVVSATSFHRPESQQRRRFTIRGIRSVFDEPRSMSQSAPLMRTIRSSVISLLAAGLVGSLGAAPSARQLTLEDCVKLALENNLELEITRFEPAKAALSLVLARTAFDPAFSLSAEQTIASSGGGVTRDNIPIPAITTDRSTFISGVTGRLPTGMTYTLGGSMTDNDSLDNTSGGASISLTQPLLRDFWIDQPRYSIRVGRNRAKYSDEALRYQIMSVLTRVESAYFSLIQARETVRVQEEALRLAEKLFEENKKRVEVGALAPLDEKQAEAETAMRRADLLNARYSQSAAQNVLKGLLSGNYPEWQEVTPEPSERLTAPVQLFNLQDSWQRAMNQRPDLIQARLEVERTGAFRELQFNQMFPQLDLTGTYGHGGSRREIPGFLDDIRRGNHPSHTIRLEFSVPIGNRAARTNHRLAKLDEEQARLRLKKLEQDIMIQVDDSIQEAQTAYERVKATERARVVAKEALDAEEKKRANGKSTSFFVLQFQKAYTDAQAAEISALATYNRALSQLAFDEGATLDRRNLKLDVTGR